MRGREAVEHRTILAAVDSLDRRYNAMITRCGRRTS